jgi:nucleoside-diphosphate-sugar epimerase
MKVLLTGGTGFVGSHVLAQLRKHDVEVWTLRRRGCAPRDSEGQANVIETDIESVDEQSYDDFGRPDVLVHLAWGGLPNYGSAHHFETELPMHFRFIRTLVEAGLPAVAVSGTCLEYGLQSGALSEDRPCTPTTPYGHAKDALRTQLEFLRREREFAMTWMRLFYVYGNRQSPQSLYSQLNAAIKRGDPQFDMSSGEQLRDYLPIEELARLVVDLAIRRGNAGTVNVCSGRPISVRSLVERWIRENGSSIRLNLGHYPQPMHEPLAFWGDRAKLDLIMGA